MRLVIFILIMANCLYSCKDAASPLAEEAKNFSGEVNNNSENFKNGNRQLNINILWDLSDRIDSIKNPSSPQQYEKDIEAIKTITEIFRNDMQKKGAYKAKGKLRVFFTPTPRSASINNIASNLVCDLSSYTGAGATKRKKEIYDSIHNKFYRNLTLIYSLAVKDNKGNRQWEGSDIWRFFKNDVKVYCVDKENNYRNILVILTDGYIYHKDSEEKNNNRTSYILAKQLKVFRNNDNWKELFNKADYGLIAMRNDLQNMEVLVLEINPSRENKGDEDFIRAYLSKWFREMGVKEGNYALFNTDLPEYTRVKIENFFSRN